MENVVSLRSTYDDLDVEFEVVPLYEDIQSQNERRQTIYCGIASVDEQLSELQSKIDELNANIDTLTNHADGIDYMIAVGSGVLAGAIDSFWVHDLQLEEANKWGTEKVNHYVIKVAQKQGYQGDDLYGAVKSLENAFPLAADKAIMDFGGGLQHHLRDFSHHPTIVGLLCSFLTQFTNKAYGTDVHGVFTSVEVQGAEALIGNNLYEKITFGIINWFFHLVSDMAGSSGSILDGKIGTGIPGPIVSLLKEVSSLPFFRKKNSNGHKEFSVWISKLFNGTLLGKDGKPLKFDLRTEIGLSVQVGQQAIPVIINECVVRSFYFIRRLYTAMKDNNIESIADLKNIEWRSILPVKNRTITRMLTISTGTMTAVDLADAAIETAVHGGVGSGFVPRMLVKVNFVGIGRFALAVKTDVVQEFKENKLRNQRIAMTNEKIFLLNAKVFYKQADMWIEAETAGESINEAYAMMEEVAQALRNAYEDMCCQMKKIAEYIPEVKQKNQDLVKNMLEILEWG